MKSVLPERPSVWHSTLSGAISFAVSIPIVSAILRQSPLSYGSSEWALLLVSMSMSFGFTHRVGVSRGMLAGTTTAFTLAVVLRYKEEISSAYGWAFLLVLCANLFGLSKQKVIRTAGLLVLTLIALSAGNLLLAVFVLAAGCISIAEAYVIEETVPRFVRPLVESKPYWRYLLSFCVAFFVMATFFALMFNVVHLSSPSGAFLKGESNESIDLGDFLYMSIFLMVTEGPPYPPKTSLARLLVGAELVTSVLFLVVYFSLLAQLFNAGSKEN